MSAGAIGASASRSVPSTLLLVLSAGAAGAFAHEGVGKLVEALRNGSENPSDVSEHLSRLAKEVRKLAKSSSDVQEIGAGSGAWKLVACAVACGMTVAKLRTFRLDDLMYVTQHTFRCGMGCVKEAIEVVRENLDSLKSLFQREMKHLDAQQKELQGAQHKMHGDVRCIMQQIIVLEEGLRSKQDATLEGVYLLCNMVAGSRAVDKSPDDTVELLLYLKRIRQSMGLRNTTAEDPPSLTCAFLTSNRSPSPSSSMSFSSNPRRWDQLVQEGRKKINEQILAK